MKITLHLEWQPVVRWLIAVVLVWAALSKLANLQEFHTSLLAYRLPLPSMMIGVVAIVLPWLELLCGLMLTANIRTRTALAWAVVLFAVFTLCSGQAWLRQLNISCGCLDLRPLGVQPGSNTSAFFESVGFAFFRAILLAIAAVALFRQAENPTLGENKVSSKT